MADKLVLIDRDALLAELQQAFDPQTAQTLISVLDKVAAQVHAAGVTREDFSELKEIVAALAEAQRQAERRLSGVEERLSRLEETVAALAEAQREAERRLSGVEERLSGVEERLSRLEEAVVALAEAQRAAEVRLTKVEERLSGVEERLARMEESVIALLEAGRRLTNRVGKLTGMALEENYAKKVAAYFGRMLRRPQVVDLHSFWDLLEEQLTTDELGEVFLTDLVVSGRPQQQPESAEVWLAVEVSAVVDRTDVERAVQRAGLLRKAGYRVIPGVAGEDITQGADHQAQRQAVFVLQNGRSLWWDEALASWSSEWA